MLWDYQRTDTHSGKLVLDLCTMFRCHSIFVILIEQRFKRDIIVFQVIESKQQWHIRPLDRLRKAGQQRFRQLSANL